MNPTMLYVDGSSRAYVCSDCGANVFTPLATEQSGELRYLCNGCHTLYIGAP